MSNKQRLWLLVSIVLAAVGLSVGTSQQVSAAVNTPVWIGAPFNGSYVATATPADNHPIQGQGQVATDFKAAVNTEVRLYAAPKYGANHDRITAKITASGASTCGAGFWARVTIYDSGQPVGTVQYGHLKAQPNNVGVYRWGGYIGQVGSFTYKKGCWEGPHIHMVFSNLGAGSACMHQYGVVSLNASNYMGYLGLNQPSKVCPRGA